MYDKSEKPDADAKSWMVNKEGKYHKFGMVPVQLLLHADVTNTELRVYACLASHADKTGRVYVSRACLAEMCGFYEKGQPNVEYISRFLGIKKGSLVKKGFVRNLGQIGFDECCLYQLVIPESIDADDLRKTTDRHSDNYAQEKKEQIAEKLEGQARHSVTGKANDHTVYNGELIFRGDVLRDLRDYHEGFERFLDDEVYRIFSIPIPTRRNCGDE